MAIRTVPEVVAPGAYNLSPVWAQSPKPQPRHRYKVNVKSMTALIEPPKRGFLNSDARFRKPVPLDVPGPGVCVCV